MDIGKKISEFRSVMESSFNSARDVAKDLSKSVKNMFHEKSSHVKSELKNTHMPTETNVNQSTPKEPESNINKFLQEAKLVNENKYMAQPSKTNNENKMKSQQYQKMEEKKPIIDDKTLKNLDQTLKQEFKKINLMGATAKFESFCEATHSNAYDVLSFPDTSHSNEAKLAALEQARSFLNPDKKIQSEYTAIQKSGNAEKFRQFCGKDQAIEDVVFFPESVTSDHKIRALTLMMQFNEKLKT